MSTLRKALKPHKRSLFAALVITILALMIAATVLADPLPGSSFDTGDGNLKIDTGDVLDWVNVSENRQEDQPSGQNDNSFVQGSKEDTAAPVIEVGSIPPNKSDLKTFGVYKEETAGGKFFLHLFWTRVQDPSGTTNMDFEFNQNKCVADDPSSVCSANGVTPERMAGDLLIVYELAKGGTVPRLFLLTWLDGTEGYTCDASNTFPCWGHRVDLSGAGAATGSINSVAIPEAESDGLGALSARTFGEASVDLSLVFDPKACTSFGSAYLKSRSSDAFTAALKDFISPQPVNISNCGTVTIRKVTDPKENPNTTQFGYTTNVVTDPPNASPFQLTDDGVKTINNVVVGSGYLVTEDDPTPAFDLTDITCTTTSGITLTEDMDARQVSFNMVVGGTVDCTFTNTQRGTIIVEKKTDPDGAADSFTFTGDASGTLSDGGQITVSNLVPGTYYSTEDDPTPAFDLTSIACDDTNSSGDVATRKATFILDPGETVKCTFTNTQRGKILVDKVTVGGNTTQFEFDPSYGDNFFLADADTPNDSGPLAPGTYSVAEVTTPDGWVLTSATCDDGSVPSSISLGAGEKVTCTFTNTKNATLIVKKVMVGGTDTFNYTGTPSGSISTDGGTITASVAPGTYTSTETVLDGWDLTSISCDDSDSTGDVGTATASFNAAAGEVITCTFTNTKRGHIIVIKETTPDGDPQSFAFSASYDADGFLLTDGESNDSGALVPGTYSVSETVPAGWDNMSATCDDGSDPGNIGLAAGEKVTCTFTNVKRGNIVVVKETFPDGDPQLFAFSASYDADGFSLSDGQSNDSGVLPPGTYSVSETVPSGWDLTGVECSDGSDPASIGLAAGEAVTCTFTNTKRGTLIVEKQTVPEGAAGSFTFTGDATGTISDNGQIVVSNLVPGTYTSTETDPTPAFNLTSITCDDANSSGDLVTRKATFNLDPGETVKCTFTNTQRGKIIVVKNTTGGDAQFDFASGTLGNFSLTTVGGTAQTSFNNLVQGTYDVAETVPTGWDLTSAACSDGSDPANIDLSPGETVTCIFNNQQLYTVIVLVCSQSTLDLHASEVTFGTTKTSLGNVAVPAQWTGTEDELMAFLCALGGAQYYDLPANPLPADPYLISVHIPLAQ